MKNFVLAIIGDKGGIGKTTIAYNLLYLLTNDKISAVLIDCDNDQYSSADFANDRKIARIKPELKVINMATKDLQKNIVKLSKEYQIIIIEFGKATAENGERNNALELATLLADKIIMPIQPSPVDAKTIISVENKLSNDSQVPAIIIANRVKSGQQFKALFDSVKNLKFFKMSKDYLKDRLVYQDAFAFCGKSIFELNSNSAKLAQKEFLKIYKEIFNDN